MVINDEWNIASSTEIIRWSHNDMIIHKKLNYKVMDDKQIIKFIKTLRVN